MRVDLSERLVHLTRGDSLGEAEKAFRSIVSEKQLRGHSNGIRGGHKVVCFSEAPIEVLARMFSSSNATFRYRPFGIMISKRWLFELGGRPVIYQPEEEFSILPVELQYRHVRFDDPGGKKDHTFEREWRIKTESLKLEPEHCTLVVPDRDWDYRLREEHDERDSRKGMPLGFGRFSRVSRFAWHVLALGDLGARFAMNDDDAT